MPITLGNDKNLEIPSPKPHHFGSLFEIGHAVENARTGCIDARTLAIYLVSLSHYVAWTGGELGEDIEGLVAVASSHFGKQYPLHASETPLIW